MSSRFLRPVIIFLGLIFLWQVIVWVSGAEPFILPGPWLVLQSGLESYDILAGHALTTGLEILLGLFLGTLFGAASALLIDHFRGLQNWLLPVLVLSQAIPVFAIAPILVIWLGYGLASKVAMACLIIFFPVTAAFLDGLRRTERGWLDLAEVMLARHPRQRARLLLQVKLPAALPAFASGLRVATAVAPIGAIVGEWVGSSRGLGYLMLHANARMQVDLMFAALFVTALMSLTLYYSMDAFLRRVIPWQKEDRSP